MTIYAHPSLQKKAHDRNEIPWFQLFFAFGALRKSEKDTVQDLFIYAFSEPRDQDRTKRSEDASEDEKSYDDENQIHIFILFAR